MGSGWLFFFLFFSQRPGCFIIWTIFFLCVCGTWLVGLYVPFKLLLQDHLNHSILVQISLDDGMKDSVEGLVLCKLVG